MEDDTRVIDTDLIIDKNTYNTLKEICIDLEERGYNPLKQIVGYLVSGDPGYISSYKECRSRITTLDRNVILEAMLKKYLDL